MSTQSYAPYRGCRIEVHVMPAKAHVIGGITRRFRVLWTVSSPGDPDREVASFPEQFNFLSEQDAFRYGESRAHTFIDSVLCGSSERPIITGGLVSQDESQYL
jgi:hypothetical protein